MTSIGSLLLAAGRGERLRPLTDHVPKPALPILDVPLGAWGMVDLARSVPPVVVNASHLPSLVSEALTEYAPGELSEILLEPSPLGTAGTVRALAGRIQRRLVTRNADLLAGAHAAELIAAHDSSAAAATVLIRPVASGADFELRAGRIARFVDRRSEPDAPGARFMGLAVLGQDAVALIPEHGPRGLGETVLQGLADRGELAAVECRGYARDVGTARDYLAVSLDCLNGVAPGAPGGWPGEIVEVEGGRAYVGPGARVRVADLGPGAVLLNRATVTRGSRVSNAIVWPAEKVAPGCTLNTVIWAGGQPIPVP
jgi:NDP-sugar pyrophosphorylase family protein